MLLNKDQILGANDLPYKDIDVPEWGGSVRIRTMTGGERDSFEAEVYEADGDKIKMNHSDFRAKMLCKCIVGEDGKRLFTDKELSELSKKSAKALNRLFNVAQDLNGMSDRAQEEITKN